MECMRYITPLLFATVVLADYYIDNANTSVVYAMPATRSGQGWQTFSASTQALGLKISNSTGNYTITLDASHCYDQNYALGVCGTADDCFISIPFVGSGITMYVFNAGFSGIAAGFSVDGGTSVSNSIDAPPAPTYQVSNVSLYDIQGLPTGNHTIRMTLMDWDGGATSMKFDYAYVNETFVASPATTTSSLSSTSTSASQTSSQTPTPTSTSAKNFVGSKKVDIGAIVGATLGGLSLLASLVIGFFYLRKHKATRQDAFTPDSTFQVNPFASEISNPTPPSAPHAYQRPYSSQYQERTDPLTRSALLRDALAAGNCSSLVPDQSSQSISSGHRSPVFQPLRRRPSYDADLDVLAGSSASRVANASSPFSDPQLESPYNLTAEQAEVIDRLKADNVPLETITRIIEGFVSSNLSADETSDRRLDRRRSFASVVPPPSYQTRDG